MRLACLHVPDFPLAAWLRSDPDLAGTPLAVTTGQGPRARVVACSPEAARYGVTSGQSAAQSVALCGSLRLRTASEDAERAAEAALCDVAYSLSPRVEDAGTGTVYLDVGGLSDTCFPSESALAGALAARTTAIGLEARVGIASSRISARLAACSAGGPIALPPEEEWCFLAPLSIRLLEPSPALLGTLTRWGIRTLGALAALPASAVATRLGPGGALLVRRARGQDERPLTPIPAPLRFEEGSELDYGIEALEPFVFVLRPLLERLVARIALRGLVCGDLGLSLGLANRGRDERTVAVAAPSNDSKVLLTLLRLHLESHPPASAVEALRLAAVPERLSPAQLDLFRPAGPSPAELSTTLARLTGLCGADRLGTPVVADSHRPDAYELAPFETSTGPGGWDPEPGRESGRRTSPPGSRNGEGTKIALRAIRPPRALEVFRDRGQLDFVRPTETSPETPSPYRCHGRVVTFAGPCRLQGEWWSEGGFSRDYYDVQLSDGAVYRLFFDRQRQQWFVDGVYD